jgi:hypothetical protein
MQQEVQKEPKITPTNHTTDANQQKQESEETQQKNTKNTVKATETPTKKSGLEKSFIEDDLKKKVKVTEAGFEVFRDTKTKQKEAQKVEEEQVIQHIYINSDERNKGFFEKTTDYKVVLSKRIANVIRAELVQGFFPDPVIEIQKNYNNFPTSTSVCVIPESTYSPKELCEVFNLVSMNKPKLSYLETSSSFMLSQEKGSFSLQPHKSWNSIGFNVFMESKKHKYFISKPISNIKPNQSLILSISELNNPEMLSIQNGSVGGFFGVVQRGSFISKPIVVPLEKQGITSFSNLSIRFYSPDGKLIKPELFGEHWFVLKLVSRKPRIENSQFV